MRRWARSWLGPAAALGVWLGSVAAQTPPEAAATAPTWVDFTFSVMGTERVTGLGYLRPINPPETVGGGGADSPGMETVALRINSQGRSDRWRYHGPVPLRFVVAKEGGGVREVAVLPSVRAGTELLILLRPEPNAPWTVRVVDDGPADFPERHLLMVNLTDQAIAGVLAGEPYELPPLDLWPRPRPVDETVRLGATMTRWGRPVPVFDRTLSVAEEERLLVVFLPPERAGRDVRVRVVRQSLAVAPE